MKIQQLVIDNYNVIRIFLSRNQYQSKIHF